MNVLSRAGLAAALLLSLLLAAPARAQLASHPSEDDYPARGPGLQRLERRGIYLGLAGDIGVQLSSGFDAKLGIGGQAKLGFSFNRSLAIYLAGAVHNASYSTPGASFSQQLILTTVHVRHFIFIDRSGVGVYYDGGIGLGFASPGFGPSGATGIGFGYSGGLGVEFPLSRWVSLAPEFYYRGVTSASSDNGFSGSINVLGLQIGLVYY